MMKNFSYNNENLLVCPNCSSINLHVGKIRTFNPTTKTDGYAIDLYCEQCCNFLDNESEIEKVCLTVYSHKGSAYSNFTIVEKNEKIEWCKICGKVSNMEVEGRCMCSFHKIVENDMLIPSKLDILNNISKKVDEINKDLEALTKLRNKLS